MGLRKKIPDLVLMVVSIIAIICFQVYWLKQNYDREEKTLSIKSDVSFREVVRKLQAKKLNLENIDTIFNEPGFNKGDRVFISNNDSFNINLPSREQIVSTVNIVSGRLKDSMMLHPELEKGMVVQFDRNAFSQNRDSFKFIPKNHPGSGGRHNYIMRLLYGVDSLQDSVRVHEIETAYRAVMKEQKINIPFSVLRLDSVTKEKPADVSVGIIHPVTYRLLRGSNVSYLLGRILSPILFSVFLIGLTLLSFLLLFRNLKRQQRLGELKNDFISNITHELKTPIATVSVAIEALKNFNAAQSPERTKEYLDISSNELQRLNLLVDKVLKLSMFEKKEIELNLEPINMKALVDEVLASLRLLLEKKNAAVSLNYSGDLTLSGDRLHLLSVVYNLIDNAIKYSHDNAVIKIDIESLENNVLLKVADNGIGIPDEYKNKVFEKFFRVPGGNVHNTKGYGLGLSYVSGVVKKHKGFITVQNNEGGGTVFKITLPNAPVSA